MEFVTTEFIVMKSLKQQLVLACIVLLLFLGSRRNISVESITEYERCTTDVRGWAETEEEIMADLMEGISSTRWETNDFLFFLHIPTIGGRIFNLCFLKHLFSTEERCPKFYGGLEMGLNHPQCKYLETQEDLSLLSQFPPDLNKSVIATMRNSVDRILSAHEFSIAVAVQTLRFPRAAPEVLEVWPWKYLVPLMQEDLLHRQEYSRREANQSTGFLYYPSAVHSWTRPNADNLFPDIQFPSSFHSYYLPSDNMSFDQRMPLTEFINHPMAHDFVHNGATFQVAGLTDLSYAEDAQTLRDCIAKFPDLEDYVLKVAKRKIDCMLFVGLTESQRESVKLFTSRMPDEVLINLYRKIMQQSLDKSCTNYDLLGRHGNYLQRDELIQELLQEYDICSASYRRELQFGVTSIRVPSVTFTKGLHQYLPGSLVQEVMALNRLDTELFDYLQILFEEQRNRSKSSEGPELDVPQIGGLIEAERAKFQISLWVLYVMLYVKLYRHWPELAALGERAARHFARVYGLRRP